MNTLKQIDSKIPISIAYSPDTDDAFMVLALREKRVDWGNFEFSFTIGDIQELNDAAKQDKYDITAISVSAYPHIQKNYLLMPIGASVGDGFGPAIVIAPNRQVSLANLRHGRIAVPGLSTTAHIAAQTVLGPFEPVPMHFMDIKHAVLSGSVDAGILIHELQLDPTSEGLHKLADLGQLWHEHFKRPLPLGANAIKRSLGTETISQLSAVYLESIELGLTERAKTIASAVRTAVARDSLNEEKGDKYISMYVNERSLRFDDDVVDGIELIYKNGFKLGFLPQTTVRDNLSGSGKGTSQ
jgi:1,4-dihydroxy-6-naphthoate synthase